MSGMGAGLTMGLMGLVPVLVIALLVWAALQLGQNQRAAQQPPERLPHSAPPASSPNPAFAILAERYARGELTREEFLERRRDLQEFSG